MTPFVTPEKLLAAPSNHKIYRKQMTNQNVPKQYESLFFCCYEYIHLIFVLTFPAQADDESLRQHVSPAHPRPQDPRPSSNFHEVSLSSFKY